MDKKISESVQNTHSITFYEELRGAFPWLSAVYLYVAYFAAEYAAMLVVWMHVAPFEVYVRTVHVYLVILVHLV